MGQDHFCSSRDAVLASRRSFRAGDRAREDKDRRYEAAIDARQLFARLIRIDAQECQPHGQSIEIRRLRGFMALCQLGAHREYRGGGHQTRRPRHLIEIVSVNDTDSRPQMHPFRGAFVASVALASFAINTLELVRRDVPRANRPYQHIYSEIFRYSFLAAFRYGCCQRLEEVRDVALEDVPAGPRELHRDIQRYSVRKPQRGVAPLDELHPRPRGRDAGRAD